jgi:hypothetical protein
LTPPFEDVHWIDPTSLEMLALIVERVSRLPVLLVITARPEFTPPWPANPHLTNIAIARLSRRECAALVERITGGKALPAEFNFIHQRTLHCRAQRWHLRSSGWRFLGGRVRSSVCAPACLRDQVDDAAFRIGTTFDVARTLELCSRFCKPSGSSI